ncbi:MAG: PASTA domain-containing protein [Myxococcales bacterium]|nr:PASTA domain-containing protein [Myxococcales bacterium]
MAEGEVRYRGPGWSGTILVSLITSVAAVLGFHWAQVDGLVPTPPQQPEVATPTSPEDASDARDEGPVEVPKLAGLALDSARELLQARGLRLVVREKRPDTAVAVDHVISQEPLPASMLRAQGQVLVTLSSGAAAEIPVPDVTGKTIEEATRVLQSAGFKLGPIDGPATGERAVASTVPLAGAKAPSGSDVALNVAVAGVEVPKLLGIPWFRAKKQLEAAGLKPGKVRVGYNDDRDAWIVLRQDPAPGTIVETGSEVDIVRNEGD